MIDVAVKRLDELDMYRGPHTNPDIQFLYAGKTLGVTAWGMNVLKLAPNCGSYPNHDHKADGQEEVYVLIQGAATLQAGDQEWRLEQGMLARVGPTQERKIITGAEGATVLAIGGTPGKAYETRR